MSHATVPARSINQRQYDNLVGFFLSMWTFHHHKEDMPTFDGAGWAEILDLQKIPWSIQNSVANFAETRANGGLYLRTLLLQKGVTITPPQA